MPAFSWRHGPYAGQKCHEVQVVGNADDANTILQSWTAKRIAVDFEPALKSNANFARSLSSRRDLTVSEGVLGLSDAHGVLLMQVPLLDRIPEKFREMMEDPYVQKVAIGAAWHVGEMLAESKHFKTMPNNFLCLRRLAGLAYPVLDERDLHMLVHDIWAHELGKEVLGVRHSVYAHPAGYGTLVTGEKCDLLVNRTWFIHCADVAVRQRLRSRIAKKAGKLSELARWMRDDWTEEEAFRRALQYYSISSYEVSGRRAQ